MLAKLAAALRDARALSRIATALERIADAQEEQVQLARIRTGGTGFYTAHVGDPGVDGQVYTQDDADFARFEDADEKRARGEWVEEEE